MRLIIGLTGGIGSGKSTVAKEFEKLGIQVVDADKVAREVVEPKKPALNKIVAYFGSEILNEKGELDRAKLRGIIFKSESKKKWLNDLLHPIIRNTILAKLAEATSDYVILEAPLLFENGLTQYTEVNVVVDVPIAMQVERAMKRDNNTEIQIKAIIDAQMDRELRKQKADYVIDNSSVEQHLLTQQVNSLHTQFLSRMQAIVI